MTKQTNVAAQEQFGQAINTGEFALFDQVVASDCVDHDPAPGQGDGPEGFKTFFAGMRAAFPDLTVEVEHLTATDDDVAIAYTVSGTHDGPFMGHGPTGRRIKVRGVQIGRFADGQLVERWGSSDELGILKQLGLD